VITFYSSTLAFVGISLDDGLLQVIVHVDATSSAWQPLVRKVKKNRSLTFEIFLHGCMVQRQQWILEQERDGEHGRL